jgi:hypothetical protein
MRLSPRTYNDFESRRFTVTVNKKNDTKESHLLNLVRMYNKGKMYFEQFTFHIFQEVLPAASRVL